MLQHGLNLFTSEDDSIPRTTGIVRLEVQTRTTMQPEYDENSQTRDNLPGIGFLHWPLVYQKLLVEFVIQRREFTR